MADRMGRVEAVRALEAMGLSPANAAHMYDNLILPVADIEAAHHDLDVEVVTVDGGAGIEVVAVNTSAGDDGGFEVRCVACGRTGRTAMPMREGTTAMCPACLRNGDGRARVS